MQPQTTNDPAPAPTANRKRKLWLWIGSTVAVLLVLLFTLVQLNQEDYASPDASKPTLTNKDLLKVIENPDKFRSHLVEFTGLVANDPVKVDKVYKFQLSYGNAAASVIFVDFLGDATKVQKGKLVTVAGTMQGGVKAQNDGGEERTFPKILGMLASPGKPDDMMVDAVPTKSSQTQTTPAQPATTSSQTQTAPAQPATTSSQTQTAPAQPPAPAGTPATATGTAGSQSPAAGDKVVEGTAVAFPEGTIVLLVGDQEQEYPVASDVQLTRRGVATQWSVLHGNLVLQLRIRNGKVVAVDIQ